MKKYLIVFLFLLALLTSCNLDNQGIFAEVLDRVPSDNRRISLIGRKDNFIYFSSVNGIEKYDLNSGAYTTIDSSSDAKKSNRFLFDSDSEKIIYFVESANHSTVTYDGYYSLPFDGNKTSLDGSSNSSVFCGSFKNYLITKEGNVIKPSITDNKLDFTNVVNAPSNRRFVKNVNDILVFTSDLLSSTPSTSTLEYYYYDESSSSLNPITKPETDVGTLRSVADNGSDKVLIFSKNNVGTTAYKLSGTTLTSYHKISSSLVSKDFASFVDGDGSNLYYVYDGSSNFSRLSLTNPAVTTTTISKISTLSIIGYFKLSDSDNVYKICTSNNGFFTLTLGDTPTIK